jgi:hypothetical protein
MLRLRKEHLAAFEAHVVNLFISRVTAHLKAVWPAECQELGDAGLGEIVRNAIQRGAALGLSTEHDLVRYVDLSFLLAKDFETNPLSAWTRPILADRMRPPRAKLDRLYQQMDEELTLIEKRKAPKP